MLKKLLALSIVAMGTMLSTQAYAVAVALSTSSTITTTNCPALDNNVTVQLSKGVLAAYNCDGESFLAAACHTAGTNKAQTVECVYVVDPEQAAGGTCADISCFIPQTGYTGCPAASTVTVNPGDPTFPKAEFNGRVGFGGTSTGGRVGLIPLGDAACGTAATEILTLVPDTGLATGTSTSN